jgi:hypothetical protein
MLEYVNIVFSFPHPSLMPSVGKNFRQKNYSAEDGIDEPNGYNIYDGISAVPQNRKFSEFSSEPFRGRKKCSKFRTLNRNRSKLSNFVPKHFEKKKNISEFHSVGQK